MVSSAFRTTPWTWVAAAGNSGTGPGTEALDRLYRRYWRPIRRVLRTQGVPEAEVEDLAQNFFLEFFQRPTLGRIQPQRGSFRAYLGGAIRRHVAQHWRQCYAAKRGGGQAALSIDDAETRGLLTASALEQGLRAFDQEWAQTVFAHAWAALAAESARAGWNPEFLRECLLAADGQDQCRRAASLGISVVCLKTRIHRARQRFRELLREEIRATLGAADSARIDEELSYLGQLMARNPVRL